MRIYIARHGQTDSNLRQTYLGHTDAPVNEEGIRQAQRLAERLSDTAFDAVYASPLLRAVQTAQAIAGERAFTMSYDIQERDYGIFDDLTLEEIRLRYPCEYRAWQADRTGYRIPQGESADEVQARCASFFAKMHTVHRDETILVVTHLGAARHMIAYLLGLSAADSWHFSLDNARYALIETDAGGFGILRGCNL